MFAGSLMPQRVVLPGCKQQQRCAAGTYHPADGSEGRPGTVVAIDATSHEVVGVIEVGRYAAGMATAAATPVR